jgi:hypothetical protein
LTTPPLTPLEKTSIHTGSEIDETAIEPDEMVETARMNDDNDSILVDDQVSTC